MFQLKNDTSEYFDFKLVNDKVSTKKLSDYLEVSIDFSKSFTNTSGSTVQSEVEIGNITLNGEDNDSVEDGFINGAINTNVGYLYQVGDKFKVLPVGGYVNNLSYDIESTPDYQVLKGGFYQGSFKLHDYPIEFFDLALSKGWTANITVFHNPTDYVNTLNEVYPENAGFIFYLGTRAENKYSDITDIELEIIKNSYDVNFGEIKTTLSTRGGEFTLDGVDYVGIYNYTDGQYLTGNEKTDTSEHLLKIVDFADLTNNAFGIRIRPDGRIGYRLLTDKKCDDDLTTNPDGVTYGWVNVTECDGTQYRQLVTPDYKLIDRYSTNQIFTSRIGEYVNITIVFERYFTVKSRCELAYSKFRKGTLKIYVNGLNVLNAKNVDEVFARELDAVKGLQEAVPYILSIGGGTQGLYEAVYLDPDKHVDGLLEKHFAGTYNGSLRNFSFYTIPASIPMIRNKTKDVLTELGIPINFGGRIIIKR